VTYSVTFFYFLHLVTELFVKNRFVDCCKA